MVDKIKIDGLKTRINSLQTQIEEKNNVLNSIITSQPIVQQKIKILKSINNTKMKNLNNSFQTLKKENSLLRKSPDKIHNQSSSTPMDEDEQKLLPVIKEKNSKHIRQISNDVRMNYNREFLSKISNSPLLNKSNINSASKDYEFSSIIRQLDSIKSENLHLKKKLKDGTLKYTKEIDIRSKEIEEMGAIRKEYAELSSKFVELKKITKMKNRNPNENNELIIESEEALTEQIRNLEKRYSSHIYENERLRQNLKTIKLKVKYLLLEKKKFLQAKTKILKDKSSQYSMDFEEKNQELQLNSEESLYLQVYCLKIIILKKYF